MRSSRRARRHRSTRNYFTDFQRVNADQQLRLQSEERGHYLTIDTDQILFTHDFYVNDRQFDRDAFHAAFRVIWEAIDPVLEGARDPPRWVRCGVQIRRDVGTPADQPDQDEGGRSHRQVPDVLRDSTPDRERGLARSNQGRFLQRHSPDLRQRDGPRPRNAWVRQRELGRAALLRARVDVRDPRQRWVCSRSSTSVHRFSSRSCVLLV